MIIKVNGYELNVTKDEDVYLGGATCGQMFINWEDLDWHEREKLAEIEAQALSLIRQSEQTLMTVKH